MATLEEIMAAVNGIADALPSKADLGGNPADAQQGWDTPLEDHSIVVRRTTPTGYIGPSDQRKLDLVKIHDLDTATPASGDWLICEDISEGAGEVRKMSVSALLGTSHVHSAADITSGTLAIARGGTGEATAQAAIDALTQVSGATNEHVLTKDTGTGEATWKAAAGGGGAPHAILDGSTHTDSAAATVSQGSIIVATDTPEWDELTIGTTGQYLRSGATDVAWGTPTGSEVVNVPAGSIAATDVQAAINELDTEKAASSHAHAASDITSGTLSLTYGGTNRDLSSMSGGNFITKNPTQPYLEDSGYAIGTSGAAIPLLNGTNTWANQQTFSSVAVGTTPTLDTHLATKGYTDGYTDTVIGTALLKDGTVELTSDWDAGGYEIRTKFLYVDASGFGEDPITCASTNLCPNLNADLLDNQHGSYYAADADLHDEAHTITSHTDVTDATGANLEELTGLGETSLHYHDGRYYTETELDAGQLDNRYFTETEHINTSAGAGDAGKPIKLDAAGHIDATMINDADIDHANVSNVTADQHHPQSHTLDSHSDTEFNTDITFIGEGAVFRTIALESYDNASFGRYSLHRARNTEASPAETQDTDVIGYLAGGAWNGSSFTERARVLFKVDGSPSGTTIPTGIALQVGSSSTLEPLYLDPAGKSWFGYDVDLDDNDLLSVNHIECAVIGDGTYEVAKFTNIGATAVNEVTITNAATGNGPSIEVTGDNSNIDLYLKAKGTGTWIDIENSNGLRLSTSGGNSSIRWSTASSQVEIISSGEIWMSGTTVIYANDVEMGNLLVNGDLTLIGDLIEGRRQSGTPGDGMEYRFQRSQDNVGAEDALNSGDYISQVTSYGYDDADYDLGAEIRTTATQDWTAANHGCKMEFYVTADDVATPSVICEVNSTGLEIQTTKRLYLYDTSQYIYAPTSSTLDIGATDTITLVINSVDKLTLSSSYALFADYIQADYYSASSAAIGGFGTFINWGGTQTMVVGGVNATVINVPKTASGGTQVGWAIININGTESYLPYWQ